MMKSKILYGLLLSSMFISIDATQHTETHTNQAGGSTSLIRSDNGSNDMQLINSAGSSISVNRYKMNNGTIKSTNISTANGNGALLTRADGYAGINANNDKGGIGASISKDNGLFIDVKKKNKNGEYQVAETTFSANKGTILINTAGGKSAQFVKGQGAQFSNRSTDDTAIYKTILPDGTRITETVLPDDTHTITTMLPNGTPTTVTKLAGITSTYQLPSSTTITTTTTQTDNPS